MSAAMQCFTRNSWLFTKLNGLCLLRQLHTSSRVLSQSSLRVNNSTLCTNQYLSVAVNIDAGDYHRQSSAPSSTLTWLSILGLFALKEEEELTGEDQIVHMVKLAVLSQQKGDYKKAERLFHVALRTAQDLQHVNGVNYIINQMANNAYEYGDYHKAEKLFINTLKTLLANGKSLDDNAVIHVSGKLACLYALIHQDLKANEGFRYCIDQLNKKIENGANDFDTLALHSLITGWFGEFLYSRLRYQEALDQFDTSYNISIKINGPHHEQTSLQRNNMAAAYASINNFDKAITCVKESIDFAEKNIESTEDLPCYYLNLGNLYLSKVMSVKETPDFSLLKEAEDSCRQALKLAQHVDNKEVIVEAELSLEKIKKLWK